MANVVLTVWGQSHLDPQRLFSANMVLEDFMCCQNGYDTTFLGGFWLRKSTHLASDTSMRHVYLNKSVTC